MASNQPGQCCTVGVKHEGQASGEHGKVGKYDAYFAYPKDRSTTNAILILTDVIGHTFINAQLIADQFAANGYFVVMPDLFGGDTVPLNQPEGFDFMKWMKNHNVGTTDPIVATALEELRGKYGSKRIGAVGYCWGAKWVTRFLKSGKVDVGFVAHPSFVAEDELKGIQGPYSIAAAETDSIFPTPQRHRSEEILMEVGQPYQINLFSQVEHGFAVRGDMSNKSVKFAKEQAFIQAVQWFDYWLKA